MKLVALIDSQINISSNHKLLDFITKEFGDLFELESYKVVDIPVVDENEWQEQTMEIKKIREAIQKADGLIILVPEDAQVLSPALKAMIQLLSSADKTLANQAVLIMSSSNYNNKSSRIQFHLRQLLEEPTVGAYTFPGNKFFLGELLQVIEKKGQVNNQQLIKSLRNELVKYIRFAEMISGFTVKKKQEDAEEDLYAKGSVATTIKGLDKDADDWLEQAAEKVKAVAGDSYVKLNRGILTVNQLNSFLNSMPMELTFMDGNNQFLYYNYHLEAEEMLASTSPDDVGSPVGKLHKESGHNRVKMLIKKLRSGELDCFRIPVPHSDPKKYVVHNYQAMKDKDGNYVGINEYVLDLKPTIDWYLKQTNQELVGGPEDSVDALSGATEKSESGDTHEVDGVSGASMNS